MDKRKNVPLIKQPYIYIGEDTKLHKNGETYLVIETGFHWIKEHGFVVWVATEEHKNTTDIDYGMSMSIESFNGLFWKP